ncbi:MAG: hypothetical protein JWN72_2415 [Thermoleophilia bacterium]|nr:hypothetical protein [Thermoleophilia bacterium]
MQLPRPLILAVVLALACVLTGCGGGEGDAPATTTSTARSASPDTSATDDDAPSGDETPPATLGSAAVARGAQLDALLDAYAPVTTRASYVIAAETLRTHARSADASAAQVQAYAGAVRLELQRTSAVLAAAQSAVRAQATPDPSVRRLQQLMLGAIRARVEAVADLRRLLAADANPETPHDRRVVLRDAWHADWDASVRAARDATSSMQDARDAVGLEPAPEDGIR